jgi:predicted permease
MSVLTRLWHRDRLEHQLDTELRFHVDEETSRLVAAGASPTEARRIAMATFGGIEPIKEAARDARGLRWLEDAAQDARYAIRTMRRHPTFTAAAVLSLAIGIGANTAIFGVLNALLLRPLPVPSPRELAYLTRTGPVAEGRQTSANLRFSYPALLRYRDALLGAHSSLAAMGSVVRMQLTAADRGDDSAELVLGQLVTGDWFGALGVAAEHGRVLTQSDDARIGGEPVAVLSDAYWTRRFARDPSIVGSKIRLNGYPVTIVGVAGALFDGFLVGDPAEVWVPTGLQQQVNYMVNADVTNSDQTKPWRPQEGIAWLTLVARVHPPASRDAASAAVDASFRHDLEAAAPGIKNPQQRAYALQTHAALADGSRGVSTLREEFGAAVWVLMATVALVLMVACANLANLLMARGSARAREFAVRLSLGARRGRLVRQLMTESLALSLLGGVVSLLFARAGSDALLRLASSGPSPLPLDVTLRWPIVIFAVAASIGSGVLFGLMPALRFSRSDVHDVVKSGGRVVASSGGPSFGRVLVVAQVALSFVLVVGALLFVRTLRNLLTIDPGFQAEHLVTTKFDPRMSGYTPATMASLRDRLLESGRTIRGAQSVAIAMCGTMANCHSISNIDVPGRQAGAGDDADVQEDAVSPGYFAALGMTFAAGRNFSDLDTPQSRKVAIVNEAMARHFFGDVNPVGRHFSEGDDYEIVGLVRDSRINGLRETPPRMAFYPFSQRPNATIRTMYVRFTGDVRLAGQELRAAIRQADRSIAVREVVTLAELGERSIARERLVSTLTSAFGFLAVAVASLGLYAMVSYSVARRRNELGIRLALGASPASVRWLVLRETIVLVALGIAAGMAAIVPALRFIASLLYGVSTRDPMTFAAAVAMLSALALVAGVGPAWRASRVDPALALRID